VRACFITIIHNYIPEKIRNYMQGKRCSFCYIRLV